MSSAPLSKKLGKLPAKSSPKALMLARFVAPPKVLPVRTNFWPKRKAFPLRSFGNLEIGDCTRASQAILAMRMERLETGKTPSITDEEVERVYFDMTARLYGGGDTGAYETDALDSWRRADETFQDSKGRPLLIDAYLAVNHRDPKAIKEALVTAGAHGIKICLNLPLGFQAKNPPEVWDVPANQALIGEWEPGSWGGHSLTMRDYDEVGGWLAHTWEIPDQRITWAALAAFCDEAHVVIDSVDFWKKQKKLAPKVVEAIKDAVNQVSDTKLK